MRFLMILLTSAISANVLYAEERISPDEISSLRDVSTRVQMLERELADAKAIRELTIRLISARHKLLDGDQIENDGKISRRRKPDEAGEEYKKPEERSEDKQSLLPSMPKNSQGENEQK